MRVRGTQFCTVAGLLPIATLLCHDDAAAVEIAVQRIENDSIVARYTFDGPLTEFQFLLENDVSRDEWQVAETSLTLAGNIVSSIGSAPFTTATLTLPAEQEYPRSSPNASPTSISMGPTSTVVNLTHLRVRDTTQDVTFVVHNAFDEGTGACVARRTIRLDRDELARPLQRYVFASTTLDACDAAARDGGGAIMSVDAPVALRELITRDFAERYDSLRQRVSSPSPKLTLFVAYKGRKNATITRVLSGVDGVVVAPLEGDTWSAPALASAEGLISNLLSSVLGEWFGGAPVAPPDGRPPQPNWLAGGAATYVAVLNGIEHGYAEDARVRSRIGLIDLCVRNVSAGLRELVEVPPVARTRHCGLLVQLVYDAMARVESAGERRIYDLWAEALAARDIRHGVDPAAFLATNRRAEAALAGLLYGPEPDVDLIVAALQSAGVDAVLRDSPDRGGAAMGLLRPFLTKACPGAPLGMGFNARDTGIRFDLGESCGGLPPKYSFIRIAERSIYDPPREIYEAVERACSSFGAIKLTGSTALLPELTLECPEQLPNVPRGLEIHNLGTLLR